ncbi:hypothetical protein PS028_24185, partial [Shigella sonnei]|nr:hypothetical protein [Shigella sonnei]
PVCNITNDWHSNGAVAVNFLRFNIQFIQLDIEPQEIDSNRPIAVPVVGDIASSMQYHQRLAQQWGGCGQFPAGQYPV